MSIALPASWVLAPLGSLLSSIVGGGTPSKNIPGYFQGSIPLMTVKDMRINRPTKTGFNITDEALANSSAKIVPADTIVIATRMGLGKVVRPVMETAINQDLKALTPLEILDKSYLEHWLRSVGPKIEAMGTGTTVKGVRLNQIKELETPLPPLNEQRRIVEKIDTLFARLDKGEDGLRAVQKLLASYRQSVLKAAVTGELTADWRAENADRLEHGRDLLARILQTRRETWQGRGKYKEPVAPDTTDLPELPKGWVWSTFDQLFHIFGGATPSRRVPDNWKGSIPWVSSGEGKTRGQAAILDIAACNNQNAAAIRVSESGVPPEYVYYFLLGNYEKSRLKGQGGNQPALNGEKVKGFLLPLPTSLGEMAQIVARIEAALSNAEKLEEWCSAELARSVGLRQSILKDAFSGHLVPQDPTDEPASEMLVRIKESRSAAPKRVKRRAQR